MYGPRHHLAPTGRAPARSGSMRGGPWIARTVRRPSRGRLERELPHAGKPSLRVRADVGARRRSSVRSGGHGSVRRSRPCPDPRSSPPPPPADLPRPSFLGGNTEGEKAAGLQSQELGPRRPDPPWRRAESALSKDRGDGRGRDIDPELQELPSNPEVGPSGILPARPKDQVPDRGIERRTTGRPRATPASSLQQVLMPSRQRVRADQEALPPVRDRTRGTAARNARSAVVKRTRLPPRRRTLSW
jgi:hypothetical protein